MQSPNDPESPSEYYLGELGLGLEWHDSLLQFGPVDPQWSLPEASIPKTSAPQPTANRIRTYPHIIIPATEGQIEMLPCAASMTMPVRREGECMAGCSNSAAWGVVVEAFKQAIPNSRDLSRTEVIERVISILKEHSAALTRIEYLEEKLLEATSEGTGHDQKEENNNI